MANELSDIIVSLTTVTREETTMLVSPGTQRGLTETAAAKLRLATALEARIARFTRERADWLTELDDGMRQTLAESITGLLDVAALNLQVLERHIDLSMEMMSAVANEAQRLSGSRNTTYGASGALHIVNTAAPISVNATL